MSAPRHAACCDDHKFLGCCDPVDCDPCCTECPSCPMWAALTAEDREVYAQLRASLESHEAVRSVRVRSGNRVLPDLDDTAGMAARLAGLGRAFAEAVDAAPLWASRSGVLT